MGGIGLDELVGVDVLHRTRRRGRHPALAAAAAAVVRKEEVRARARVLWRRACESGGVRARAEAEGNLYGVVSAMGRLMMDLDGWDGPVGWGVV